jgi:HPt (histidine-containing phosphotransfer) domain-containing protein
MSGSGFDSTLIEELIEVDPSTGVALVRELIGIFFSEAPARLDRMRCGLAQGDAQAVLHAAHAMKGGANNLGAVRVGALCGEVEARGRRGDLTGVDRLVDAIEVALPEMGATMETCVAAIARSLAGA